MEKFVGEAGRKHGKKFSALYVFAGKKLPNRIKHIPKWMKQISPAKKIQMHINR